MATIIDTDLKISFDENGNLIYGDSAESIVSSLKSQGIQDLLIFVHGFNNTADDVKSIYKEIINDCINPALDHTSTSKFGVLKIFWPSQSFDTAEESNLIGSKIGQYGGNLLTFDSRVAVASKVGENGFAEQLAKIYEQEESIRLHLIGHSTGTVVIQNALTKLRNKNSKISTVALIQSIISRSTFLSLTNTFINKVKGCTLITFLKEDEQLNPLATLIQAREEGFVSAAGNFLSSNLNSFFGGSKEIFNTDPIGLYGADQKVHIENYKLSEIYQSPSNYHFTSGCIYNLDGDGVLKEHNDYRFKKQVGVAILKAIAITQSN